MSKPHQGLTREQLLTMFGVQNGTRLSEYPWEIPSEMVRLIIDTDAQLRAELEAVRLERAAAQQRYEQQCEGSMSRLQQIQSLTQQLAEAKQTMSGAWESMANFSKRIEELKAELEDQSEQGVDRAVRANDCASLRARNATLTQQLGAHEVQLKVMTNRAVNMGHRVEELGTHEDKLAARGTLQVIQEEQGGRHEHTEA